MPGFNGFYTLNAESLGTSLGVGHGCGGRRILVGWRRRVPITRVSIVFFILGLVAEFVGFASGHAAELPFAMALVSPSSHHAQEAVSQLQSNSDVAGYDVGFDDLGSILLESLRKDNPPELFEQIKLERIRPKKLSTVRLAGAVQKFDLGIVAVFSNSQEVDFLLSAIQPRIDAVKKGDLLEWAMGVFAFGVALQIAGFINEWRQVGRRAV